MLRPAVPADLPRLLALRDASGADALSDPALATEADLRRLIEAGAVFVWDESASIVGFAAVELQDGAIRALLVDPAHRNKGLGRDLLAAACASLKQAGHAAATLALAPGSTAARHYRAAGWTVAGASGESGIVLQKLL